MESKNQIQFIDLNKRVQNYSVKIKKDFDRIFKKSDYVLGESLQKFEKKISEFTNSKYVIGVNSGYDALFLALKCIGISRGDEVITVSNSYVATVNAIANIGAKPVLVDICDDLNIDVTKIVEKISKKTKAIICVHLTGNPCDMDEIKKISKKYNLKIIEDCAQAIGAQYKKKHVGNFGEFGCFSLHPAKNLHVLGDGGFITTNKKKYFEELKKIRNHGHTSRELIDSFGINSRLDSIQAIYANIMLNDFKKWQKKIDGIANYYNKHLCDNLQKPIIKKHSKAVFHNYIIQTNKRDELKKFLEKNKIDTRIHYPISIHEQKIFLKKFGKIKLSKTEILSNKILSLPIYPELSFSKVKRIVKIINNFLQE